MTMTATLTPADQIKQLVRGFLAEMMDAHIPQDVESDYDLYLLETGDDDRETDILRMQLAKAYSDQIVSDTKALLAKGGLALDDLPKHHRDLALEATAQAHIELIRYGALRRKSAIDIYTPDHPFFHDEVVNPASHSLSHAGTAAAPPMQGGTGGKVGEMIEKHLADVANQVKPGTLNDMHAPLAWFAELVSPDLDVRALTGDHVLQFKQCVLRLKCKVSSNTPLAEAQTDVKADQIDAKTAQKKFGFFKAFLYWLRDLGAIVNVPGAHISIKAPKKPKSEEPRSFKPAEFDLFFSSPMYSGRDKKVRFKPGPHIILDDDYWMPLVLAYTGMRLHEPLQIDAEDVVLDGPVPYFRLLAKKIELKTVSSDRVVPVHPDLVAYGFLDFVKERLANGPSDRLFRGFTSEKSIGNYYSQRAGRYLDKIGLTDELLVMHSFRHTFKDALRNGKVPEGEQDFILGHSNSSPAHNYGDGSELEILHDWVAQAKMPISEDVRQKLVENRKLQMT